MLLKRLPLFVVLLLAACGGPEKLTMYPQALTSDASVDADMAVVLVGNAGPSSIDYLQFGHSSLPAINVRGMTVAPNSLAGVPIPVGTKSLSLQTYTIAGRSGTYLPNGKSVGFMAVHSPQIDISARGLYYVATLYPGSQKNFSTAPDPAMLARFRKTNPQLAKLDPINFSWPR